MRRLMHDFYICCPFSVSAEHLKREFSVENLLFYRRVLEFENACRNGDLKSTDRNIEAVMIYVEFISDNGELQVLLFP